MTLSEPDRDLLMLVSSPATDRAIITPKTKRAIRRAIKEIDDWRELEETREALLRQEKAVKT